MLKKCIWTALRIIFALFNFWIGGVSVAFGHAGFERLAAPQDLAPCRFGDVVRFARQQP
ncbi:MAG TPA: hypothetical protein VMU41_16675 [Candidatus Binataceae bacterium]|nr:hypothetical protein [Candidatus Binataceae bacterium]